MVKREFWIKQINNAWSERNIIWLSGVRRVGKTCLSQSLDRAEYFDCELPRIRKMMIDPQAFLDNFREKIIILDEVHRLENPSELLKIAADHYPDIRVLATGSSTLGASAKFKDTLAGRKKEIWMTPMNSEDLKSFGEKELKYRFLRGGLPPFYLSEKFPESYYQEWIDAYWAKDIQELFRLERRYSFQKFTELLMANSGGIFEATRYARPCEVSRQTISNYLKVLEATFVVHVIRPFSTNRTSEIVSAPKIYGFDTGFVSYYKGWYTLRPEDMGVLWEHYVLNEIQSQLQTRQIYYWRDKQGHEIDFILARRGKPQIAIECKLSTGEIKNKNIKIFNSKYPEINFFIVSCDTDKTYKQDVGGVVVTFVSLGELIRILKESFDNENLVAKK